MVVRLLRPRKLLLMKTKWRNPLKLRSSSLIGRNLSLPLSSLGEGASQWETSSNTVVDTEKMAAFENEMAEPTMKLCDWPKSVTPTFDTWRRSWPMGDELST
ncbi:hypothetical protein LSTR_LSTR009444 [Laodelphax striatellus]|uniref:Uncharacterized protein n=1 Tax=Laodelphax striatellus TaxID=195883 RepID=A0A482WNR9_LAOST|nr:hypothetical protein LSTR_LSTR009444 [Laodelphax striatellus]